MNNEQASHVAEAVRCLRLRDIQLFNCRFDRPTLVFPEAEPTARQEHMRGVRFIAGEAELEGRTVKVLQILVKLGTRVVADVQSDDPEVYFLIEAEFQVEYEMTGELDEKALATFANLNGVHNVWPFWRQHVYDIVQRARLPQLDIPLFAGSPS
jgi:hypothetical protein